MKRLCSKRLCSKKICSALDNLQYLVSDKIYQMVVDTNNQLNIDDEYDRLKEVECILIWDNFDDVMNEVNKLLKPYGLNIDGSTVMDILQDTIVEVVCN